MAPAQPPTCQPISVTSSEAGPGVMRDRAK